MLEKFREDKMKSLNSVKLQKYLNKIEVSMKKQAMIHLFDYASHNNVVQQQYDLT